MEKQLSMPVWLKLTTGDSVFGELQNEKDGVFFVKNLYQVHFMIRGGVTHVALTEWIPYSNNKIAPIMANNVVAMGNLESKIKKMYGDILLQNEIEEVKEEIMEMMLATPVLKPEWIEEKLNEILKRIVSYSVRFDIIPPPIEDVTNSLYDFIIKKNEPETETRH